MRTGRSALGPGINVFTTSNICSGTPPFAGLLCVLARSTSTGASQTSGCPAAFAFSRKATISGASDIIYPKASFIYPSSVCDRGVRDNFLQHRA